MMQVVEMTQEQKVEMYMKCSKKELIEMLINCNIIIESYSFWNRYKVNPSFANLFGNVSYFTTETGATISINDFNCLSDDEKQKCNPIYK